MSFGVSAFAYRGPLVVYIDGPQVAQSAGQFEIDVTGSGSGAFAARGTKVVYTNSAMTEIRFPAADSYTIGATWRNSAGTIIRSAAATISDTNRVQVLSNTSWSSNGLIQALPNEYPLDYLALLAMGLCCYGFVIRPGLWRFCGL